MDVEQGVCDVCGRQGRFVDADRPTRENFRCEHCGASLRYRLQARAIATVHGAIGLSLAELSELPPFCDSDLYEPGVIGPFRKYTRSMPGYINSFYWPDVELGETRDGVRCEDLRALTLADDSLDLVVSSDIFEHVRGPTQAFAEIFRVLRSGGYHVFTVPVRWPLPSQTKQLVDCSGSEDVFLVPPRYHGSPKDPEGSLVYTEFGMDLPESLRELGFETAVHHGYRNAVTFASRKP